MSDTTQATPLPETALPPTFPETAQEELQHEKVKRIDDLVRKYEMMVLPSGAICTPDKSFVISMENAARWSKSIESLFKHESNLYKTRFEYLTVVRRAGNSPSIGCSVQISMSREKGPYFTIPATSDANQQSHYIVSVEAWDNCQIGDEVFLKTLLNLKIAHQKERIPFVTQNVKLAL